MNKSFLRRILLSAAVGHISAIAFVLIASAFILSFENPLSAVSSVSLTALALGAFVCAFVARKTELGIFGGVLAGTAFALLLLLISLIFGKDFFAGGEKFLVAFLAIVISGVVSGFVPKKKRRHTSVAKRKKDMYKRVK